MALELPAGSVLVRLQDEPDLTKREALMAQVHDLIRQNYGSYADSEPPAEWLANMARSGTEADGFRLLVTALLDADGKALAFSSAEVLPCGNNRYIYNAYTCIQHKAHKFDFEGSWVQSKVTSGPSFPGKVAVVTGSYVDWGKGQVVASSPISALSSTSFTMELLGETYTAELQDGKLVWSDGEEWAQVVEDNHDLALIYAVKKDAALAAFAVRDQLAAAGINVQGSFQDHMLHVASHGPKIHVGFSLGQMPLGALGFTNYQLPVYSSEVAGADGAPDPALLESKKVEGSHADLFLADFGPNDPSAPFATILQEFAAAYAGAHSVYAPDLNNDPAYRAMSEFAAKLSPTASYSEIFDEAYSKAAEYLQGLKVDPATQGRSPAATVSAPAALVHAEPAPAETAVDPAPAEPQVVEPATEAAVPAEVAQPTPATAPAEVAKPAPATAPAPAVSEPVPAAASVKTDPKGSKSCTLL